MITLYQLHWSHYVEKVRWALDFKRLEWSAVDVDPFTKREMRHLQARTALESGARLYTVPTIHDDATGDAVTESSAILRYLERTYPAPALYPAGEVECDEVERWMLWLDSTVGLAARRLAYTQIALEHPGYLAELFIPQFAGVKGKTAARRIAGSIVAGVLTRRFRFVHNRADRVFETLEQCLLLAARRLQSQPFLVGSSFTAADLTLASLLRPATVVPFFRNHPGLQHMFEWRAALLQEYRRDLHIGYEIALHEARKRRGWALGAVRWLPGPMQTDESTPVELPTMQVARNDQQPMGRRPMVQAPFWFLRLMLTSGLARTPYP